MERSCAPNIRDRGRGRLRTPRRPTVPHGRSGLARIAASASLAVVSAGALIGLAVPPVSSATTLPDNRAYEQVTPHEKGGSLEAFTQGLAYPTPDGESALVPGGFASAVQPNDSTWIRTRRTPSGWTEVGSELGPPIPPGFTQYDEEQTLNDNIGTFLAGVSPDLERVVFATGLPIDPRDQNIASDVYSRSTSGGPFEWVSAPPGAAVKSTSDFAAPGGASADLSTVAFTQREPLLPPPGALPPDGSVDTHAQGNEVYESVHGVSQLVGILPDGSVPPCGASLGNDRHQAFAPVHGTVSPDGSQVTFTSPDPGFGCGPPEIYMRVDGSRTISVSASMKTNGTGAEGKDGNGPQPKWYVGSATDGSKTTTVFFISSEELTNNANTGSERQGADLYEYDVAAQTLVDVTAGADEGGAGVIGFAGASTDGSYLYFAATGALAPGATASQPNLYVYNARTGAAKFIAPAGGMFVVPGAELLGFGLIFPGFTEGDGRLTSRVTPDGRHLVFLSTQNLTPFDQHNEGEVYLYDAEAHGLSCISCNPAGTPPVATALSPGFKASNVADPAAGAPMGTGISADGRRVFFTSPDQLTSDAPHPTIEDVVGEGAEAVQRYTYSLYQWESGKVYLISGGEPGTGSSYLFTTTPSGNDVFFSTARPLSPADTDGTLDVYDARVHGGFAQLSPPTCSGAGCQGVPGTPAAFSTPASLTFAGVGNFAPPAPAPPAKRAASSISLARARAKALRACRKKPKRARASCERRARHRHRGHS
jgi:hypothetical protein